MRSSMSKRVQVQVIKVPAVEGLELLVGSGIVVLVRIKSCGGKKGRYHHIIKRCGTPRAALADG